MRSLRSAIELPVQDDSAANARSHRHVNQPRFAFPRSPARFAQRRRVAVILDRRPHAEFAFQISHRTKSLPAGQKIHVAEFSRRRIHHSRRADSDARDLHSRFPLHLSQHFRDPPDSLCISARRIRRRLRPRQDLSVVIHDSRRDFRSSDVHRPDHRFPLSPRNNPASSSTMNEHSRNVSQSTPESCASRSAASCAGIMSITNCHSAGIAGSSKTKPPASRGILCPISITDAPSFSRSRATARSASRIFAPSIHIPNRIPSLTISCGPWRKLPVPTAYAGDFTPSSHSSLASYALPRLDPLARKYVAAPGASHGVSSCFCQPAMAFSASAIARESSLASFPFGNPRTALASNPAVSASVVYVTTEIAWSISVAYTSGNCASRASVPSGAFVTPMTAAPLARAFSRSCTISTLRPLREITISADSRGSVACETSSAASSRYTGRPPPWNSAATFSAACQLLPIPVRYTCRAPRTAALAASSSPRPAPFHISSARCNSAGGRTISRKKWLIRPDPVAGC